MIEKWDKRKDAFDLIYRVKIKIKMCKNISNTVDWFISKWSFIVVLTWIMPNFVVWKDWTHITLSKMSIENLLHKYLCGKGWGRTADSIKKMLFYPTLKWRSIQSIDEWEFIIWF